jgi:hypothetical protein
VLRGDDESEGLGQVYRSDAGMSPAR